MKKSIFINLEKLLLYRNFIIYIWFDNDDENYVINIYDIYGNNLYECGTEEDKISRVLNEAKQIIYYYYTGDLKF